ncbi:DNA polymerase IV [Mechercharimyces sp. CAU 1602]|uniref:DNA polymerase IV n=1 Tax=Mechercharimyces sp. CAU 1602 TaxID=2973933 RepID=UPI002161F4CF|nr:DNA polymerase IV [Mechercharimyces sp. CAU 1602]MCS1352551.1 DNA polymerase IV [Mechercharimyces sp. CAU 1602]
MRKIIHIDMDAFFAAVEQRENPDLQGKPVVIGGDPYARGVVATCSYEARKYGIHSAMPSKQAQIRCPHAIFIRPRMSLYKEVSQEVMEIFHSFTSLVEPLSLDEAYLDVSENKVGMQSATLVARQIKERIWEELKLTASAGVSYNKFIAKLASGYRKPDGLTVITPEQAQAFLDAEPIHHFWGVGKVTAQQLKGYGIETGADLRQWSKEKCMEVLGSRGELLYRFVRGEDERPVNPKRIRKSIGRETTLQVDLTEWDEIFPILETLVSSLEAYLLQKGEQAQVLVLKVKFHDFKQITRRLTLPEPISTVQEMMSYLQQMSKRAPLEGKSVRLVGVTLAGFVSRKRAYEQLRLF